MHSEIVNELIKTGINFGNVLVLISYFLLVLVVLKIVETGVNIIHMIKGKKEKIVREIETIEKRKKEIKPVLKEFKADSLVEEMLKDGRVKLVCPVHGCDVQILIDGSIYCPECERQHKKEEIKEGDEND
jgi:hypothetical protein